MRSLPLVFLLLIGACTAAGGEPGTNATSTLSRVTSTSSTTTTTTGPTTTIVTTTTVATVDPGSTIPDAATGALVTDTGVVVAVLEETSNGHLVTTPCGNEEVISGGTPIGGISVVIDAGHGGEVDTGAVGANGLMEKHLNLTVAQAVEAKLIVRGVPVILTRTGDYASTLTARTALADQLGADLLLSIHHNAPSQKSSSRPGTEVFIQHDSADSRRLGGLVWSHVVQALSQFDVQWSSAKDAGVLTVLSTRGNDAYGINRNPETVSALVELGYISNPPEAALFSTDAYVQAVSDALADAVQAYLGTDDPGAGFVAEPRVFNPQPGIGGAVCQDPALS